MRLTTQQRILALEREVSVLHNTVNLLHRIEQDVVRNRKLIENLRFGLKAG